MLCCVTKTALLAENRREVKIALGGCHVIGSEFASLNVEGLLNPDAGGVEVSQLAFHIGLPDELAGEGLRGPLSATVFNGVVEKGLGLLVVSLIASIKPELRHGLRVAGGRGRSESPVLIYGALEEGIRFVQVPEAPVRLPEGLQEIRLDPGLVVEG
jgi:hypothetical protein